MPVIPRPAATVVLIRDDPRPPSRLQVFLQRRVAGMAFAGGMTVFPGGGVDPGDHVAVAAWTGPPPEAWAARLGHEPALAAALVRAAVRETFEECGVLLAGPGPVPPVARDDLVARRATLAQVLDGAGLALRADLLLAWSRWITPEASPKRYDTAFLVACVPEGQEADARTTEAVEATWWHPATALADADRGEIQLMAPTRRTLEELAEHADCAAVLAAAGHREIVAVVPRVRPDGGVWLPGDPEYVA